jgi:predicted RNA-binding Zn-ribbon protein involved in translation (DUF1610 family)
MKGTPVTNEEFLNRCRLRFGDLYDLSRVKLVRMNTKIVIGCKEHGWITVSPISFLNSKYGCPRCGTKIAKANRLTGFNEWVDKCNLKFNNKYAYSCANWESVKVSTVKVTCPEHGEFEVKARAHWESDSGCRKCANAARAEKSLISTEKFIERSKAKHGEKFDYSHVSIQWEKGKLNRQARNIYCNIHNGFFDHDITAHMRGIGCPVCHVRNKDTDAFIREAKEQHGDKYNYDRAVYAGWDAEVIVTCPMHGDWKVQAYAHTRKDGKATGCQTCGDLTRGYSGLARFRNDPEYAASECEIYLVEIDSYYKIGIATDLDKRHHKFARTIHYRRLTTRCNAWVVEQKVLADCLFAKPSNLPAKFDGWDGVEELRYSNLLSLEDLLETLDSELDDCEKKGMEEYVKANLVTDLNLY